MNFQPQPLVYLAASPEEAERAQRLAEAIDAHGHYRVHDRWWNTRTVLLFPPLEQEQRRKQAIRACVSVSTVRVFWLLYPEKADPFPFFLFGRVKGALGHTAVVLTTGAGTKKSVFCSLADFEAERDEDGLVWLLERKFPHGR